MDNQQRNRLKRRRRRKRQQGIILLILLVSVLVIAGLLIFQHRRKAKKDPKYIPQQTQMAQTEGQVPETETQLPQAWSFEARETGNTKGFPKSVVSEHGILIDVDSGEILAQKGARERISPASMTKILTVLVAAEHITTEQLTDKVTITKDITDYSYSNGCSNTGYEVDEQVTVEDLFYGTILPSGADSAVALAVYVAGSHEAFVELMNEKLEELGLSESTHFTNCVGLYDEDHYSTVYDMAVILKAATDIEWCRQVLSAHTYTTSSTKQHPEGLTVSNWFLRRIEDKDTHGEVLCAKTGFVAQSGSCAASLANDEEGEEYLCVTAGSTSSWRCIYDQVDIYDRYLPDENVPEDEDETDNMDEEILETGE
ncbi:MAG: D-alanyl-D-alanine carboxypeptidase family protein [Agathobacter sp.]